MPTTLLLFSEGLDSYLAGKLMKRQGIQVIAVRFITPFFGWSLKQNPAPFYDKVAELGFDKGAIIDITDEYLDILKHPAHGWLLCQSLHRLQNVHGAQGIGNHEKSMPILSPREKWWVNAP